MAYGQTDDLVSEREGRVKAVNLLLAVATGKKNITDVQKWLEREYPEMCRVKKTLTEKKW